MNVTEDQINAAKLALNIPERPLSDEELADAMVGMEEWLGGISDAATIPTASFQSGAGRAGPPSGSSANTDPFSGHTNASKELVTPEGLAQALSEFFGPSEMVCVKPDDPRIPAPLRMTPSLAAAVKWKLPETIIGVVCGRTPQPLSGIVFSDKKQFETFKGQNPGLSNSLTSNWPGTPSSRTYIQWLRCGDSGARNWNCGKTTWVDEGVIPVATHGLKADYFLRERGPISCVNFAEIKWPPAVEGHLQVLRLERSFGARYNRRPGKEVTLNIAFFAQWIAQLTQFTFIGQERTFFVKDGANYTKLTDEGVLKVVMILLHKAAAAERDFPRASLRPSVAKQIVEHMKIALAVHLPGREDTLSGFLDHRVECNRRSSLTVLELYAEYRAICDATNQSPYPPRAFQRLIATVIEKKFGALKSHDLARPGDDGSMHAQRGFHGLGFKQHSGEAPTKGADASDSADEADGPDGTLQALKDQLIADISKMG